MFAAATGSVKRECFHISHVLRQEAHNRDIAAGWKRWPQGEIVEQSNACLYISCTSHYVYQSLWLWFGEAKRKATLVRDGSFVLLHFHGSTVKGLVLVPCNR